MTPSEHTHADGSLHQGYGVDCWSCGAHVCGVNMLGMGNCRVCGKAQPEDRSPEHDRPAPQPEEPAPGLLKVHVVGLNPRHAHLGIRQGTGLAGSLCVDREWWRGVAPNAEEGDNVTVTLQPTNPRTA